jgi:hypothetical protein
MDIEKRYKLFLIDKSLEFPEWNLCEELLGGFGDIKKNISMYKDGEFVYLYDIFKNKLILNDNIHEAFRLKYNMDVYNIDILIKCYIDYKYNILIDIPIQINRKIK